LKLATSLSGEAVGIKRRTPATAAKTMMAVRIGSNSAATATDTSAIIPVQAMMPIAPSATAT